MTEAFLLSDQTVRYKIDLKNTVSCLYRTNFNRNKTQCLLEKIK